MPFGMFNVSKFGKRSHQTMFRPNVSYDAMLMCRDVKDAEITPSQANPREESDSDWIDKSTTPDGTSDHENPEKGMLRVLSVGEMRCRTRNPEKEQTN